MSRVAVAGATGQVGRRVVAALRRQGHEAVELSRGRGVDVLAGTGLEAALTGVDAVVDVLSTDAQDEPSVVAFFGGTTDRLLAAESPTGVRHHVLLSIVGVERVPDLPHYAGKRAQEERVATGPVPWSILPATQFHSFAATAAGWTLTEGVATVAPLLVQPVDVDDVASVLVELALGEPVGRAPDLAGPETWDLVDMAVRTFAARGEPYGVRASWRDGPLPVSTAGEALLPGPGARIGRTTFTAWLDRQAPEGRRHVGRAIPVLRRGGPQRNRAFWVDFLGFDPAVDEPGFLMLVSPDEPAVQVIVGDPDASADAAEKLGEVDVSVDVGDVDEAYARAQQQGLEIIHPITTEWWGPRRFFVRLPGGTVVNVVGHPPA